MNLSHARKLPLSLALCFILAWSPFARLSFLHDTGYHNSQRIIEAMFLTFAVIGFFIKYAQSSLIQISTRHEYIRYLLAFFLFGFISSLAAFSLRFALYEWASFVLLFMVAWLVASEISRQSSFSLDFLLLVIGYGAVLYLFRVVLIYITILAVGAQPHPADFVFGFDNYRFFNHTQTVSLPFLTLLTLRSKSEFKKYWSWFAVTALWWTMLWVSTGRGTFIGLIAGAGMAWYWQRRVAQQWCRLMVLTAIAGGAIYILFFVFIPISLGFQPFGYASEVIHRSLTDVTSGRTILWSAAWDMVIQHPLLGVGPLHFAHFSHSLHAAAHPHNWLLQIAAEWGIPSLIFLVIAGWKAWQALLATANHIRSDDFMNQAVLTAWITIGVAVIVDGLFSGLLVMPTSQLWIALYLGCAWGWRATIVLSLVAEKGALPARTPTTWRYIPFVGITVVLVLYWCGLFPEVLDLDAYESNALDSGLYLKGFLWPRIWNAGYF